MSLHSFQRAALAAVLSLILIHRGFGQAPIAPTAPIPTTVPSPSNYLAHPPGNIKCMERVGAMMGKPCDILFIGDSITENFAESPDGSWDVADGVTIPLVPGQHGFDLTGRQVWEKHYAGRNALNFGVSADGTENILWRMDSMNIGGFRPKVVVIMAGTNDIHFEPDEIAAGVKAVVDKTRGMFPEAKIILISILPNARATQKMADANQIIRTFADNQTVFYFDLASMMTPEGDSWRGIGHDRLHVTPEGYEMWASGMEPLLTKLLAAQ
jgi:lysophospholipase L1-like esterase